MIPAEPMPLPDAQTPPRIRDHVGGFVTPILLFAAPVPLILTMPSSLALKTWAFYSVAIFGVDVSVIAGVLLDMSPWYTVPWVTWGQLVLALFVLENMRIIRRWRRADAFFHKRERRAQELARTRKLLHGSHFWGLVLFTLLPVGSGVYLGVALGKALGMSDPRTFAALALGTFLWTVILAFGLVFAWDWFRVFVH